jgi:hypothetical protein
MWGRLHTLVVVHFCGMERNESLALRIHVS